uniref:Peroxisomal multifunctional enzyme type 2 n=1 Tax=Romanomermis culicivorax TaxID=13658 RepID=A0A915HVM3_ROMCU
MTFFCFQGLGREYALLFAKRGASVIVNDLGSSPTGDGKTVLAADDVVQQIKSLGGIAVANYDSVENGENLVKAAIEKFGRIDVIVNNAGFVLKSLYFCLSKLTMSVFSILRDKQFKNLTDGDWNVIFNVHVKGAFQIVKAAWHHMCAQKIIFTSSNSGIYGNFGQVNYSSAKAALVGFSKSLAKEGQKYNIFSNVIVPTASSRLTKSIIPEEIFEKFDPRFVAPIVAYLCHESCPENGGVFEAAGGWFGKRKDALSCFLKDSWSDITDMSKSQNFETVQDECFDLVQQINISQKAEEIQEGHFKPTKYAYTPKDAILYAISIGATVDKHLHVLYENHDNFTVFPLFAVVPCSSISKQLIDLTIPNINLDFTKLLHGEQYFEFKKTFKSSGCLTTHYKLADVLDKGDSAILLLNVEITDENNETLAVGQYSLFFRGTGNFGGQRESKLEIKTAQVPRDRKPDFVVEEKTDKNQAALYRQTGGDYNPIHIDPALAQFSGFSKPILHGLCTLGYAARHLLDTFSPNDYSQLKTLKVRFTKPVLPGQTLVTEMWRNDDGCVQFQTKVKESGQVVIGNAFATCFLSTAKSDIKRESSLKSQIKSRQVFDQLKERLSKDPNVVEQVQAIYLWIITQNGEEMSRFTIDLKNGKGYIYEGNPKNESAGVTMTIDDQDMVDLIAGKLNSQKAFMAGKLKLKGNIMLSQKLQRFFNNNPSKL